MVSSSWANNEAVWHLDYWWKHAKSDCDKPNFFEIEFDLVIIEVKVFEIVDSLSGMDLFFDVLLNQGNVYEPKVIGMAE
jgi:hypothetical protein